MSVSRIVPVHRTQTGRPPVDVITVMSAAAIGCGFVVLDTRGRIVQVSESACSMFGVTAPDVAGEPFETVVKLEPEEAGPGARDDSPVSSVLRTRQPRAAQVFRVQRRDRRLRWVQVGIAPLA